MYYIKRLIARIYGAIFKFYHSKKIEKEIAKIPRDEKGRWIL